MKVTVTSIELKSFFHFFSLANSARHILQQLKAGPHKGFRKKGWGKMHYTMTLWEHESDLKSFAQSGPHAQAMKKSARIAREIRTITYDASVLPSWAEARSKLASKEAKVWVF